MGEREKGKYENKNKQSQNKSKKEKEKERDLSQDTSDVVFSPLTEAAGLGRLVFSDGSPTPMNGRGGR